MKIAAEHDPEAAGLFDIGHSAEAGIASRRIGPAIVVCVATGRSAASRPGSSTGVAPALTSGTARQGMARQGPAGHGRAWQGGARHGGGVREIHPEPRPAPWQLRGKRACRDPGPLPGEGVLELEQPDVGRSRRSRSAEPSSAGWSTEAPSMQHHQPWRSPGKAVRSEAPEGVGQRGRPGPADELACHLDPLLRSWSIGAPVRRFRCVRRLCVPRTASPPIF